MEFPAIQKRYLTLLTFELQQIVFEVEDNRKIKVISVPTLFFSFFFSYFNFHNEYYCSRIEAMKFSI